MELKEFVVETISSLADAVDDLQKKYEPQGVIINPPSAQSGSDVLQVDSSNYSYRRVQKVAFDVAVTVSQETNKAGKAGIKVFSAELGGEVGKADTSSQVSHVKFEIPIAYQESSLESRLKEQKKQERRDQGAKMENRSSKDSYLSR